MLSFLLNKFGLGKVFTGALLCGIIIGTVPTAIFVNNVWNGKIKKDKIHKLETDLSAERLARQLAENAQKSLKIVDLDKEKIITSLREQNSHLADVNAIFAERQAARDTLTIQTGDGIKNEAAKTDSCATSDMDDVMRRFANGEKITFSSRTP